MPDNIPDTDKVMLADAVKLTKTRAVNLGYAIGYQAGIAAAVAAGDAKARELIDLQIASLKRSLDPSNIAKMEAHMTRTPRALEAIQSILEQYTGKTAIEK